MRSCLGILTRNPSFQFVGTCSYSLNLFKGTLGIFAVSPVSDFNTSCVMLCGPLASPFFICLIAVLISSSVGEVTSVGRSVCAVWMLDVFDEAGLFRRSSKCSPYLFRWRWIPVIDMPSFSLTGRCGLQYFLPSFFVASYIRLTFLSFTAFSAITAPFSEYSGSNASLH